MYVISSAISITTNYNNLIIVTAYAHDLSKHNTAYTNIMSGWPSGPRRCVQVAVQFSGRGFESHF